MRYIRIAVSLSVVCLILAATGLSAFAQGTSAVTIADFQFSPSSMQVAQGTTVTWTNNGPSPHTSTSDTGAWDSGTLQPGKSFSFKFNTPGTFAYHCAIHPNMKATIAVTSPVAGASASTAPSASTPATPAQLPKTGSGGGGGPAMPLWLLGLVPLACAAVILTRFLKGETR